MLQLEETILGRYRISSRLSRGGMSEVYLAHDEQTHQNVAIKLVNSYYAEYIERLQREAKALGQLRHDHILPTLEYGEQGPWHYLVMPYMEHGTLRKRLAKGRLSLEEAGRILEQIASALQYAHERGMLHRDIKASNILFANEEHAYLADFGLAKTIGERSNVTQTGCLMGTPEYMAPELAEHEATTSSDIYALGILLYQMVTGLVPFRGGTPLSVYWKQIREQPEPPSHLNPAIPYSVEQVILRALEKDPSNRFTTPLELAQAYTQALESSEQSETARVLAQNSSQVRITYYKVSALPAESAPIRVGLLPALLSCWQRPRHAMQTPVGGRFIVMKIEAPHASSSMLSRSGLVPALLVLMFLFVAPLSLGFMMSKSSTQAPQLLGTSAQLAHAAKFQQGLGHSPSPQQSAPSANNASNISYEQESRPSIPSVHSSGQGSNQQGNQNGHGHKYEHGGNGHEHGDDDSPHPGPEVDIAV